MLLKCHIPTLRLQEKNLRFYKSQAISIFAILESALTEKTY